MARSRRRPEPTDAYDAIIWRVVEVGLRDYAFDDCKWFLDSEAVRDSKEFVCDPHSDRVLVLAARDVIIQAARNIGADRQTALALIGEQPGTRGLSETDRYQAAAAALRKREHEFRQADGRHFAKTKAPMYVTAIANELLLIVQRAARPEQLMLAI